MYEILLTLHIVAFGMALALTAGASILAGRVGGSKDPAIIHTVYGALYPVTMTGGMLWFVTGALGFWVAAEVGLSLGETWLTMSFAVFAVLLVTGFFVHAPYIRAVIAASERGAMTPELEKALASPAGPIASAVSAVSTIALVYLMIAKPG